MFITPRIDIPPISIWKKLLVTRNWGWSTWFFTRTTWFNEAMVFAPRIMPPLGCANTSPNSAQDASWGSGAEGWGWGRFTASVWVPWAEALSPERTAHLSDGHRSSVYKDTPANFKSCNDDTITRGCTTVRCFNGLRTETATSRFAFIKDPHRTLIE